MCRRPCRLRTSRSRPAVPSGSYSRQSNEKRWRMRSKAHAETGPRQRGCSRPPSGSSITGSGSTGSTGGASRAWDASGPWFQHGLPGRMLRLRVHTAEAGDGGNPANRHDIRSRAEIDLVLQSGLQDGIERLAHLGLESFVDFLLGPEVAVAILDPLEVRGRHAG